MRAGRDLRTSAEHCKGRFVNRTYSVVSEVGPEASLSFPVSFLKVSWGGHAGIWRPGIIFPSNHPETQAFVKASIRVSVCPITSSLAFSCHPETRRACRACRTTRQERRGRRQWPSLLGRGRERFPLHASRCFLSLTALRSSLPSHPAARSEVSSPGAVPETALRGPSW